MINENFYESLKQKLKTDISQRKYLHSIRVMETSEKIIKDLDINIDINKVKIASLLHDCARDMSTDELKKILKQNNFKISHIEKIQPVLLHAKVGVILAKDKYGVNDIEILNAIACHTTAKEKMSIIDKIIFVSDYIEPERMFQGIDEIRITVYNNFEKGVKCILQSKIIHVVQNQKLLHNDTVKALNWVYMQSKD